MIDEPDDDSDQASVPEALPAKERVRINPKLGLASMVYFVMDLRMRGRMRDGEDAAETWVCITPADLEKLEDIADTLEWFRLQRLTAKLAGEKRRR